MTWEVEMFLGWIYKEMSALNKNGNGVNHSVRIISFELRTSCDKISPCCWKPSLYIIHPLLPAVIAARSRSTGQVQYFSLFLQLSAWPYKVPFLLAQGK